MRVGEERDKHILFFFFFGGPIIHSYFSFLPLFCYFLFSSSFFTFFKNFFSFLVFFVVFVSLCRVVVNTSGRRETNKHSFSSSFRVFIYFFSFPRCFSLFFLFFLALFHCHRLCRAIVNTSVEEETHTLSFFFFFCLFIYSFLFYSFFLFIVFVFVAPS